MASGRAPERWERKVIVGVRIVRNKGDQCADKKTINSVPAHL